MDAVFVVLVQGERKFMEQTKSLLRVGLPINSCFSFMRCPYYTKIRSKGKFL